MSKHLKACRNNACSGCGPESDQAKLEKFREFVELFQRWRRLECVSSGKDAAYFIEKLNELDEAAKKLR